MIFLMGAEGFVGSAFARYFEAQKLDYAPLEIDTYQDCIGERCDVLINADGNSRKYLARKDPVQDFHMNVDTALESMFDFRFGVYVLISTVDVYEDLSNPTNNVESAEIDHFSCSNYGFNKYLTEMCVRQYAPKWLIVRLAGMVGPGLGKNCIYDLLHNEPLWVHPDSKYQYMKTDDVARIVWTLVEMEKCREVFNVCGDGLISPREVAELADIEIKANPEAEIGQPEWYEINNQKLKSVIDMPQTRDSVEAFVRDWQRP